MTGVSHVFLSFLFSISACTSTPIATDFVEIIKESSSITGKSDNLNSPYVLNSFYH